MREYSTIFWDFDGVIKDSVGVKTEAFTHLFEPFGDEITEKVRVHHEANGGMSRFDKIPLYLQWAGVYPDENKVIEFCEKFSQIAFQNVIDSSWVTGVEDYLSNNYHRQKFVIVTATPEDEMVRIIAKLNLAKYFVKVFGSPTRKEDAIQRTLVENNLKPIDCLMIGDAQADLQAAKSNGVPFLLRKHASNAKLFASYKGKYIKDFTNL